jgi:CubicO group peptidase (beta-lactamase class C family)
MPSGSGADFGWLDELAVEEFNRRPLAGLALGVVRGGELAYDRGLGFADVAAGRRVTADTVFRIGSISKTFTAIAVMQLVEQGLVDVDDPVNEHLRGFRIERRPGSPAITIRHLLTHTSGLGELRKLTDVARPVIGLGVDVGKPMPTLPELYAPVLRAEIAPDEKWAYANHGFAALGQLVEDVVARPFAEHLREAVFEPLGMRHTDFLRSERVRGELAIGYAFKGNRLKPVKDREIIIAPAGSIFSSVRDLALYAAALIGGGANEHGRVLEAETLQRMWEPQLEVAPGLPAMGLAFFLHPVGGHRVVGHDGGWPGFVSALLVAPDDGVAVVVFTNTSDGRPTVRLSENVLQRLLGAPAPEPPGDVPQRPDLWSELTGLYKPARGLNTNARTWEIFGGEVEVLVRKGRLTVRALSPLPPILKGLELHPADCENPLRFVVSHAGISVPVVFERDESGVVRSVAEASRFGFTRLYRVSRARSLRLWGQATAAGVVAGVVGRRARRSWRARRKGTSAG